MFCIKQVAKEVLGKAKQKKDYMHGNSKVEFKSLRDYCLKENTLRSAKHKR